MQTAQVDDSGSQLAYIDSGAPPGNTYTTLVCVHGHTYHAQNYSRLLPLAQEYNLRVIALNRRDYISSTPFSQSELDVVGGKDVDAQTTFMKARGLEIARFLVWVITEMKIPQASADGSEGGIALSGWSLGNVTTLAFLRHLGSYPPEVVSTLEPYLRTFFIYECGYSSLGYPSPEGAYHPLRDSSIPQRMRGIAFGTWVSSYYSHPLFTSTSPDVAPQITERNMSAFQVHTPETDEALRVCTFNTLTPSELTTCLDPVAAERSDKQFFALSAKTLYDQTVGSLLLDYTTESESNRAESKSELMRLLPKLKVRVVYGTATVWSIIWGAWEIEKDIDKWLAEHRQARPFAFITVKRGNHFLHWDEPDLFLKVSADGIRS